MTQSNTETRGVPRPALPPRYTMGEVAKHLRVSRETLRLELQALARRGIVFDLIGVGRAKLWTPEQVHRLERELACPSSPVEPPGRRGRPRLERGEHEDALKYLQVLLAKPKRRRRGTT